MDTTLERDLIEELKRLPSAQQRQVLHFARSLHVPALTGVPGKTLLSLAGTISPEDATEITAAIAAGCEQIDDGAW